MRTQLVIARSAAAHGELVEPRGGLAAEAVSITQRDCHPRIECGVAMTGLGNWVRVRALSAGQGLSVLPFPSLRRKPDSRVLCCTDLPGARYRGNDGIRL